MKDSPTERSLANERDSEERRIAFGVWLVASLTFLVKLALALRTFGTNDVYTYEQFSDWSRVLGAGLYRALWNFNHPPSMIHLLRLMGWLSRATPLPFAFWLRLPEILADAGSLGIVWVMFAGRRREPSVRWTLMILAASPALVMVSGFHGNTDSLMIFFLLLSVYLTERGDNDLLAGAAFGLSFCVKIVPVIAVPIMFLYRPDSRRRLRFFLAAGGIALVAWSPFLFQDPVYILRQVFGYRSFYGLWGFSWIATWLAPWEARLNSGFRSVGAFVLLALIVFVSFRMNRSARKPSLYSQMAIVFFLFLAGTNAFSVQYLAWLPPWTIGLAVVPVLFHAFAAGAFLFLVYDFWSQGSWYLADANRLGNFTGHVDYFQLVCWASVFWLLLAALEKVRGPVRLLRGRLSILHRPASATLLVGGLVVVPFVIALVRLGGQSSPDGKALVSAVRAGQEVELEAKLMGNALEALYTRHDSGAAVALFRQVLARNPTHYGANFQIAAALEAAGRHAEAVPYWKRVSRIARSVGDKATADTALAHLGPDAPPK